MDDQKMFDIVPGKWYFTTICKNPKCGLPIVFAEAPAPQDVIGPMTAGSIRLTCNPCGHKDVYHPDGMQIVQASRKQ